MNLRQQNKFNPTCVKFKKNLPFTKFLYLTSMGILSELNSQETFEGNFFSAFQVLKELLCVTYNEERAGLIT
jgi:hypothetical protein